MTFIGYNLDNTPYITEEQLDWVREQFIEEWRGPRDDYYVWHRDYKELDEVNSPYKNMKVIVLSPKEYRQRIGRKYIYVPFRYLGVPLVVWK